MTKHTKTPWNGATGISSIVGLPIVSQEGRPICNLMTVPKGFPNEEKHNAEALANAAFIVRACNSHQDLVDAARLSLDLIERVGDNRKDAHIVEALKAALAAAEAK